MSTVEKLEKQIEETKEKIAGYNKGKETKKKLIACNKSKTSTDCTRLTKVVDKQTDDKRENEEKLNKLEGKLKKAKIEAKRNKNKKEKKIKF